MKRTKPILILDWRSTLAERRAATSQARNAALARLKAEFQERYRELYVDEARKRGISPKAEGRGIRRGQQYARCSPGCSPVDGHTLKLGCVIAEDELRRQR